MEQEGGRAMSLADNARRAQALGLSYGKYMSLYGKSTEQVISEAEARRKGDVVKVSRPFQRPCPVNLVRFRQEIQNQSMTQRDVAKLAGVSEPTISYILHGANSTRPTLEKLAAALGIKTEDLIKED